MKKRSPVQAETGSNASGSIAVVDDDPLFRESITQNLTESGFEVADFDVFVIDADRR